ncbi:MAG: hypothetical protein AAGN82_16410 [Myxococcota bacterium]
MKRGLWAVVTLAGLLMLPRMQRDATGVWSVAAPMREAGASTSVAYTLEELIDTTATVVLARAVSRESRWEEVGGSKRIVTYTVLDVEEEVMGAAPAKVWVRTLGGTVGDVGQHVAGEARFEVGVRSVVFLTRAASGVSVVAGAAQGHYPAFVKDPDPEDEGGSDGDDDIAARLRPSPSLGHIVERPGPRITALQRLVGRTVPDAVATIVEAKAELDAHRNETPRDDTGR